MKATVNVLPVKLPLIIVLPQKSNVVRFGHLIGIFKNVSYDIFLQLFKAVYPNPSSIDIQYDLDKPLLLLSNKDENIIFNFLKKNFIGGYSDLIKFI